MAQMPTELRAHAEIILRNLGYDWRKGRNKDCTSFTYENKSENLNPGLRKVVPDTEFGDYFYETIFPLIKDVKNVTGLSLAHDR